MTEPVFGLSHAKRKIARISKESAGFFTDIPVIQGQVRLGAPGAERSVLAAVAR